MNLQITEETSLVTLVGPPNSGKTTLFNLLSGKNYKTVNYPGSTVEYSTSRFLDKYKINAEILDSPGIISLIPNSPDEKVSVDSLYNHPLLGSPKLIIITIDASQLSRHLLLVIQLIESGFKVIIVLTMNDILQKKGLFIPEKKLSEKLNCDVIKINGRTGEGIESLIHSLDDILKEINENGKPKSKPFQIISNKIKLIDSYKKIEEITNDVLEDTADKRFVDIERANKHLKIISTPYIGRENTPDELTLRIDRILLHKVWGIIIFILIMGFTFSSIFWLASPLMGLVDNFFSYLAQSASNSLGDGWFSSLVSDGIISGVGSVLVFVPQIIILFLILGVLEDTGYLARGAMLIDKPLSKIGLNGRSFVPMLSGFACAIPAMLAARTIPNRRERLLTIFILPLMSCSARLPVYALLLAYLTPSDKPWIGGFLLAAIYLFSTVTSVIVVALINKFRKNIIKAEDNSSFILELPTYKIPTIKALIRNTYSSSKQYVYRAGPIIIVFSLFIWFLTYFPGSDQNITADNLSRDELVQLEKAERLENSYAAHLGKVIQPVMTPLGLDWRVGVSLMSAFVAREVFVSSLALIFKVTESGENLQTSLLSSMEAARITDTGKKLFTPATIIGLIVFFAFALQCISTVAVSRKETGGWRIPLLQIVIFTSLAYVMAFIMVNGLRLLGVN
ncbi:MAG: ferrous iron transport protein B [Bacteroidetes bacterium]|nr:ferrous iron transport protein B [Bacteroidota bacterium]